MPNGKEQTVAVAVQRFDEPAFTAARSRWKQGVEAAGPRLGDAAARSAGVSLAREARNGQSVETLQSAERASGRGRTLQRRRRRSPRRVEECAVCSCLDSFRLRIG